MVNIVLRSLVGALFVFFGLGKLMGAEQALEIFQAMGTEGWMPYVIGVVEIVAGTLLMWGRRVLGTAILLTVLMIGAMASHAVWGGPFVPAAIMWALSLTLWRLEYNKAG